VYAAAARILEEQVASQREVCQFLGLTRSAFQTWKSRGSCERERRDLDLLPRVVSIFHRHRRRYGTRRLVAELRDRGQPCGRRRVQKLLKIAGLSAIQPKSFQPRTTESRHTLGYSPNLILDLAEPSKPNQLWVGDITYVPVAGLGFGYLSILMDRCSRRIVGWAFGEDMTESLVVRALRQSIRERQPPARLIHHTDRGGQYAGAAYRAILRRASMHQSMSRAGDCYDNAFMESCFGTIKTELEMTEYQTYRQARRELSEYLHYYNFERRHSSLGYLTPNQFEAATPRSTKR
jgi:transposase InsO family protein